MLLVVRVGLVISTESGVIIMEIHLRCGTEGTCANAKANAGPSTGVRLWSEHPTRSGFTIVRKNPSALQQHYEPNNRMPCFVNSVATGEARQLGKMQSKRSIRKDSTWDWQKSIKRYTDRNEFLAFRSSIRTS